MKGRPEWPGQGKEGRGGSREDGLSSPYVKLRAVRQSGFHERNACFS